MATRAELRARARERADMENSTFISDAELNIYLQQSWFELYDLLVASYEDYYTISTTSTLTSGNTIALPADFYKLRGIDYQLGGTEYINVRSYNFAERNLRAKNVQILDNGRRNLVYRLLAGSIVFLPENDATGTYKIWYIPRCGTFVDDTTEVSNVLDFDEYIVVDAAIKMLVKEESDPSALLLAKDALKKRVEAMASNRDAGEPQTVADVRTSDSYNDLLFPRG